MANSTLNSWLLGTAQFGMSYGVTNVYGQTLRDEAWDMINLACELGGAIGVDTAAGYGQAEEVLSLKPFSGYVTTKISSVSQISIRDQVKLSLAKMRLTHVDSLLVHDTENLSSAEEIVSVKQQLHALKEEGLILAAGVSVYDIKQIDRILPSWVPDIVQVPLNPLNQSFIQSGTLTRLKELDVQVQARSLFLQGVLLAESLPQRLSHLADVYASWIDLLQSKKVSAVTACKSFAIAQPVDHWVLGFENLKQLRAFIDAPNIEISCDNMALNCTERVDPRRW